MLLILLFVIISSPMFSLALKPPSPEKDSFDFSYEGPVNALRYRSVLSDGKPYYEEFSFSETGSNVTIILALRGETNSVVIGRDLNLIRATFTKSGRSLTVRNTPEGLTYSTNGVDFARYPLPNSRVVIFPEIQLRDFFFSKEDFLSFTFLATGDYRMVPMYARKHNTTNLFASFYGSQDTGVYGAQEALPVEILAHGLSPAEWAMVYYFDDTGWPIRKQGFFNTGYGVRNRSFLMIPQNSSSLYYLGEPSYSSDLITKGRKNLL